MAAPDSSTACSTAHTATAAACWPHLVTARHTGHTCRGSGAGDEHRQEDSRGVAAMKAPAAQLPGAAAMFSMQWSRQHGSQARTVCTEGMVGVSGATSKALTAAGVVGGVPHTSWRVTAAGKEGGQVSNGTNRVSNCQAQCHQEHKRDGKRSQ